MGGGQRTRRAAKAVILLVRPHAQVLDMDMRPRRDGTGGDADDLTVFQDRFAGRDGADGHLVARGDRLCRGASGIKRRAGGQGDQGDHDVVAVMQADGGRRGLCHGVTRILTMSSRSSTSAAKRSGRSASGTTSDNSASVGISPSRMAAMTRSKSGARALRLPG